MKIKTISTLLLFMALIFIGLVACRDDVPLSPSQATVVPPTSVATVTPLSSTVVAEAAVSAIFRPAITINNKGPHLDELSDGWTKIEPGGDSRCAHNTPYAYWVKRGTINKLLIYFQGGGGCWNGTTCNDGSTFYDEDVTAQDDPQGRSGILDLQREDNPFHDYHMVYIPSCTGDVYWGDNVQDYVAPNGEPLPIYHRGFVNGAIALTWAYDNIPAPDSVFVTGCSAGSVGSRVHAPYIIENYPNTTVTQLGDSLAFVFNSPPNPDLTYHIYDNFPSWIPALDLIKSGPITMAEYDIAVANHYANYTFAQYNTKRDSVQVRFYSASGSDADGFEEDLTAHLSQIHADAPNFRSYTADGTLHCIMPRREFYTAETAGVAFRDWVANLADNHTVESVKCDSCQVALPAIEAEVAVGKWREVGTMPTPRSENRGVVVNGRFYIPGGWGGESVFEAYDPQTDRWQTLAHLPEGRHHFMITAVAKQIYLFGGSQANAYQATDTAWRYDIATDSWSTLTNLPAPRMGGAAVTIDGNIYIIGGETEGDEQPLLRYDPIGNSWHELAPLNQPREHTTAVAHEGKIYVMGGWWRGSGELTSLEIYDPATDVWQLGAEMGVARGGLAAAVLNGRIYLAGGEILSANRRTEQRVEVYDPISNRWQEVAPMPAALHGFPLLAYEGALWVIGGSDQAAAGLNNGRILQYSADD